MKSEMSLAAAIALIASSVAAQVPGADSLPPGWRDGSPASYAVTTDRTVRHSGEASGKIRSRSSGTEGFGTILQGIRADDYRGQRVRLTAWVKSQDAQTAQLWMRVDALNATLDFDNMDDRPIRGTQDWTRCDIVLDVPADALSIVFGLILVDGTAWIDDVELAVVPAATPHTGANSGVNDHGSISAAEADSIRARAARRPAAPRNPGFEERP